MSETDSSRRHFLAGAVTLAAGGMGLQAMASLPAMAEAEVNHPAVTPEEMARQEHSCDVLVIGGGMAGLFAAVKAADSGATVMMAVKGRIGASGQTPWARKIFSWYPTHEGMPLKEWLAELKRLSQHTCNQDFARQLANHALARINELKEWGFFDSLLYHRCFTAPLAERGVERFERLMITHLVREKERIIGAAGFAIDDGSLHFFAAKSVVLCTGSGGFKPAGLPVCDLTADGAMMAWRIGAKITGKEWNNTATGQLNHPAASWRLCRDELRQKPQVVTTDFAPHNNLPLNYEVWREGAELERETEVHYSAGGPKVIEPRRHHTPPAAPQRVQRPILTVEKQEPGAPSGGAAAGLAPPCSEGIAPVNTSGLSSVPGLYAAGDALGSCVTGALQLQEGAALAAAAVQGAQAGRAAALAARKRKEQPLQEEQKEQIRAEITAPLTRSRGFSPDWVTRTLQGVIIPNFVLYIKKERMLQAALAYVEELQENHQPHLIARNFHELRLAHETANMLLNAEMKLRASLFRKESRCTHYRVDYPKASAEWECWITISRTPEGTMKLEKQPFAT